MTDLLKRARLELPVAVLGLLCTLVSIPVRAQSGDIISADYGANNRWVNVTNQVRSKVRNGRLNFRVNNDAFGVGDPAPGVKKTLRLRVRQYNGQTRDYRYQENEVVDIQVGNYGSGYPPNRPGYGHSNYRLRSDDQSRFDSYYTRWLNYKRTNNQGEVRSMEKRMYDIYSSYNIPNSVPFYQVASPNVAQPEPGYPGGPGWNNNDLRVNSARYGAGRQTRDVTGRVQSMVRNGTLNFRVNNDSLGGDPAPGQSKQLYLRYWYRGQERNITVQEGQVVRIP
jgi:hypothetical protein